MNQRTSIATETIVVIASPLAPALGDEAESPVLPSVRHSFRKRRLVQLGCLLFAVCACWCIWLSAEGHRHATIAEQLIVARCGVEFTHTEFVPIATSRDGSRTTMREISTLHPVFEMMGLETLFRRIKHVRVYSRSFLPEALDLIKEIEDLDGVSFSDTGITQSQLSDTFSEVRVRNLYARSEMMPRTNLGWLNHDGLQWLCLNRTQLSNPAVNDLPTSLEYFDATRTRINDDGLAGFVRLKNLKMLNLSRTPTSKQAIDKLQRQMLWCEIKWEPLQESSQHVSSTATTDTLVVRGI